ncbi:mediator of DNA damage checkpoint protein 1-like [Lethenteron reissneri]|uniref:mediator of DNA damage checkpoint protein 1-like n=1 Tax=Lethenteron reissneri TaxID=7753 RepID=UPI002AB6AB0A|nr:mediator of DNA damage checkpoint protein 1-like [Lethenteron reissneri]
MLCAVARGVPVVTPAWIQQCEQSGRVVDSDAFIVSDEEQEAKFHFRLRESLLAARERPLFHGCRVHVTAGVKPEPVHMRDIVECGGATWLPKVPRTAQAGLLVVSCPEDSVRLRDCRGVDVVSAELILTGVLRQRLDVDAHRLSISRGDEADSSDIDGGRDVEQRARKRASVPAARGAQVASKRRR